MQNNAESRALVQHWQQPAQIQSQGQAVPNLKHHLTGLAPSHTFIHP